jgi:hypothetical protein
VTKRLEDGALRVDVVVLDAGGEACRRHGLLDRDESLGSLPELQRSTSHPSLHGGLVPALVSHWNRPWRG